MLAMACHAYLTLGYPTLAYFTTSTRLSRVQYVVTTLSTTITHFQFHIQPRRPSKMREQVELPAIQINSQPATQDYTSVITERDQMPVYEDSSHPWDKPEYPLIADAKRTALQGDGDVSRVIEARLRDNVVRQPHSRTLKFWPIKLFDYLFQDHDVGYLVEQLVRKGSLPVDDTRDTKGWTDIICGHCGDGLVYRRLMALLLLIGKAQCIYNCISERFTDKELPIDPDNAVLRRLGLDHRELDLFCQYQGQLSVPLFRPPQQGATFGENAVYHVDLTEGQAQPWDYLDKAPRRTQMEDYALSIRTADTRSISTSVTLGGGYGEVHRVIIHPWQHEFQEILKLVC